METLRNIVLQELNELRFSRKHIDAKIRKEIEGSAVMVNRLEQGVALIQEFLGKTYYQSKMDRLAQLDQLDLPELVMEIFVGIAYSQKPELLTAVSAQIATRIGFDDKVAALTTTAELLAVLCETDAFDITKASKMASLMVVSRIPLSEELLTYIEESTYLPPMACEPLPLTHNYSSGYLTHNDSLILGSGNQHDGDLCLDVLNTMNKVALKLDIDFLSQVEEEANISLDSIKEAATSKGERISEATAQERYRLAVENWSAFKVQSYKFYYLMQSQGNRFHFCWKVDKRGRIYSCGFHLNPQGTAFKKASLEFAEEEFVDGVPT